MYVYIKILVLKGIIGYSDYSFEMMIFETNRIFIFKPSHLWTLAVSLLVF